MLSQMTEQHCDHTRRRAGFLWTFSSPWRNDPLVRRDMGGAIDSFGVFNSFVVPKSHSTWVDQGVLCIPMTEANTELRLVQDAVTLRYSECARPSCHV